MKLLLLLGVIFVFCIGLTGCATYSSANMARIHSDNTTVLGPWGYIHCGQNSSITFYTGRQITNAKNKSEFVGWPTIPTIQEDSNANLNIGKPSKTLPTQKVVTTEETPGIEQATAIITK